MKINTKVVFEWNPESKQYEEIYCDSYDYDGEVSQCQYSQSTNQYASPYTWQWDESMYNTSLYDNLFGNQSGREGGEFSVVPETSYDRMKESFRTGEGSFSGPFAPSFYNKEGGEFSYVPEYRGAYVPPYKAPDRQGQTAGPTNLQKTTDALNTATAAVNLAKTAKDALAKDAVGGVAGGAAAKEGASSIFGSAAAQGGMMAGGGLLGGITGYMQAKSQQKGLSKAIGELDPIKTQALGAYKRSLGLAESYRPGGTYSRYMGGKILSQAEESVGQETSRMIASGITSPSMMRQIGHQSRRQAEASLPGMEMQISQMALPYEQLASGYFGEYRGLSEQMAGLKGARGSINPWSSAVSGAMSGAMGAATMIGSLVSDRRMKKDIKYLHTSNEGHRVYSFKYKDGDTKYSGVMAQDVLKINPDAVTLKNGMLAVYYDMIDVDMQQLDIIQ
jgi:hypothetical protein